MHGNYIVKIEVVYALAEQQVLLSVDLPENATVQQAIEASRIAERFPQINWQQQKVGVFSQPVEMHQQLQQGDRVEIYRPLVIDPKQARRLRAKRA